MNTVQIQAYVQSFLHTNDPVTISNIPVFVSNAASRVASNFRNLILEKTLLEGPTDTLALPLDFLQARMVLGDSRPLAWVTPERFAELKELTVISTGPAWYTIASGFLYCYPAPAVGISLDYLGINQNAPDNLAAQLPAMLIQGAVAEGMKFEGDEEGANNALADFQGQIDQASGWEINGTISLGGVK